MREKNGTQRASCSRRGSTPRKKSQKKKKAGQAHQARIAANDTFGAIAEEHIANLEKSGKAPATIAKHRWFLEDLAGALWKRPIAQITPAEILAIIKRVEANGRRETARKLRSTIGRECSGWPWRHSGRRPIPPTPCRGAIGSGRDPASRDHRREGTWSALGLDRRVHGLADSSSVPPLSRSHDGTARRSAPHAAFGGEFHQGRLVDTSRTDEDAAQPWMSRFPNKLLAVLRGIWDASDKDGYVFPSIRSSLKALSENAA